MLAKTVLQFHRIAILAILTLALVATGAAHRMPDVSDQALAFMAATGASAADICGETGPSGRHAGPLCQACQIAGGVDLPPALGATQKQEFVRLAGVVAPRESRLVRRILDASRVPQGPPVT